MAPTTSAVMRCGVGEEVLTRGDTAGSVFDNAYSTKEWAMSGYGGVSSVRREKRIFNCLSLR
jgi:hypothetical protein